MADQQGAKEAKRGEEKEPARRTKEEAGAERKEEEGGALSDSELEPVSGGAVIDGDATPSDPKKPPYSK